MRFGKVKVPSNLFNEIQDIDPAYLWGLLPQSIYPLPDRNYIPFLPFTVGWCTARSSLGKLGKLEYRGWGEESELASNDGYFVPFIEAGISAPNGSSGTQVGEALHWQTPLRGLMIGASNATKNHGSARITAGNGAVTGTFIVSSFNEPAYFARHQKNKAMVAVEYQRQPVNATFQFAPNSPPTQFDNRSLYGMASYKVNDKLTGGFYYSQGFNRQAALGPARYQKDWDIAGRYDFNQYVYAKAEEHFIEGTAFNYDVDLNPNGLQPNTKLTVLKIGVSFYSEAEKNSVARSSSG